MIPATLFLSCVIVITSTVAASVSELSLPSEGEDLLRSSCSLSSARLKSCMSRIAYIFGVLPVKILCFLWRGNTYPLVSGREGSSRRLLVTSLTCDFAGQGGITCRSLDFCYCCGKIATGVSCAYQRGGFLQGGCVAPDTWPTPSCCTVTASGEAHNQHHYQSLWRNLCPACISLVYSWWVMQDRLAMLLLLVEWQQIQAHQEPALRGAALPILDQLCRASRTQIQ